ncbi:MAG: glutamate-5-semialdehyde dehydrogenase [Oscillospiraceae bacterium]|nr:glutamate-5-semialdehyde dehydrogenase [Oscillospiraceae bacterium]
MTDIYTLAARAKAASVKLGLYDTETKNRGLEAIACALEQRMDEILAANEKDISAAVESGTRAALIDRLTLTAQRVAAIANSVRDVIKLPDPVGEILEDFTRPNGIRIRKVRVPLGVVGIIYEARPNVTVDSAVLCFKSGNVAFLRGGKEAFNSNMTLMGIMRDALEGAGLEPDCLLLLDDTSRKTAQEMMCLRGYIDVLIPRGGPGLIRSVVENAKVPVIETGTGNCHLYVDAGADIDMAVNILFNGKCSRPSVCNALETVLVHRDAAEKFLPAAKAKLDEMKVQWRGEEKARAIVDMFEATEDDFADEFGDYILAARVVDSIDEAIAHIAKYTTHHSECIVTSDAAAAERFTGEIDAAAVYVNASTRFTDGGEFGLGAEIGISTQKTHARGPMGLKELTSYKYIVTGNGQIR